MLLSVRGGWARLALRRRLRRRRAPGSPSRSSGRARSRQGGWRFRVVDEAVERVLQSVGPDGWRDLYAFTLEPQLPIDYRRREPLHVDAPRLRVHEVARRPADALGRRRDPARRRFQSVRPARRRSSRPRPKETRSSRSSATVSAWTSPKARASGRGPERRARLRHNRPARCPRRTRDPTPSASRRSLRVPASKTPATRIAVVGASNEPSSSATSSCGTSRRRATRSCP